MYSQVFTMECVPEIKKVESHLTWINDILAELTKSKPNLSKVDYVLLVLRTYNSEYFEKEDGGVQSENDYRTYGFEDDYNKESPKYANLFAKLVNKCAKILYVREKLDSVPLQLKKLREIVANLNGDHKRLEGAFEYCIEALEWSLKTLKYHETDGNFDDVQILQEKWKALQKDPKSLAAIAYLKATLQVEFNMEEIDVLYSSLLPETIDLDPTYHIWYHNLYTCMRNVRKFNAFSEGGMMEAPSEKEVNCCNRQLELAPNLLVSNVDMALLQKDVLWMTVYKRQRHYASRVKEIDVDFDEVYQKCMHYFDTALKLAEEDDLQKWILKLKYEKADVLIHVKDNDEIRNEGLSMLSQLVEAFPNDAILHYKVGRLYLYGVYLDNIVLHLNASLSQHHFKKALKLRGYDFFPCIRDYMKSFKFSPDPLAVKELWIILENIEHAFIKRCCDSLVYKVRIWKAFVLWIYNPEDIVYHKRMATKLWLDAFGQYDDEKMHRDNIFRPINQPPFATYKGAVGGIKKMNAEINLRDLTNELILIMNNKFNELESRKNAEIFLKEIEKMQPTSNRFQQRCFMRSMPVRTVQQTSKTTKVQEEWRTSTQKTSDADNDTNWRKK